MQDVEALLRTLDAQNPQIDEVTINLLEKIAQDIGAVGWEIGPDIGDPRISSLSFNAGLSEERLQAISHSISIIDPIDCWILYAGLPPKDWEIFFEIEGENGAAIPIEGSEWHCTAIEGPSRDCLALYAPPNLKVTESTLQKCAELIAIGEIGEKNCIDFFSDISVHRVDHSHPMSGGLVSLAEFAKKFATAHPESAFSGLLQRKRCGTIER